MSASTQYVDGAGLRLRARVEGAGPPLLILHGFSGCAEAMAPLSDGLRDAYRTLRVDLLGHGGSAAPASERDYGVAACTAQLAAVLDVLAREPAFVAGYSFGGRMALALAAAHPERVRALAVIGASAGLADAAARAARVRADRALADAIERDGLPAFVERWMALPLFASQRRRLPPEALVAARAQRLASAPHGLANSLRGAGSGAQPPLHGVLPRLRIPTLLVVGEDDAKFRAIAAELAAGWPDARVAVIPEAGHATHLENPGATSAAIRAHFARSAATRSAGAGVPPAEQPGDRA